MIYTELKNKQLNKNIYLLVGDSFLIKQTINQIAQKYNIDKINISEFNDENFDARAITNACNQFSFFSEKRIVVAYEPAKELINSEKSILLDYTKNPNADCLLLFVSASGLFDFIKDIETIECKPSDLYLSDYVKKEFEKYGKTISSVDANKLISYCKGNLNRISLEIKKISDYLDNENIVTAQIIDEMVTRDTELKVFDLTTHISQKNAEKAHKVLFDMLKAGEPPYKILGLISSHFRRVFFAKINKGTNAELAKALGCKEYAVTKAKEESARFTAKQLKDIQNLILEADYNIKSGFMSQENTLYYLVMKISLI